MKSWNFSRKLTGHRTQIYATVTSITEYIFCFLLHCVYIGMYVFRWSFLIGMKYNLTETIIIVNFYWLFLNIRC